MQLQSGGSYALMLHHQLMFTDRNDISSDAILGTQINKNVCCEIWNDWCQIFSSFLDLGFSGFLFFIRWNCVHKGFGMAELLMKFKLQIIFRILQVVGSSEGLHTWTDIRLNPTWVKLGSKGTRRTPSSRASKWAPTWCVCTLAPTSL